jgi:hypothetical protein
VTVVNGYCTTDQIRAELSDDGQRLPVNLLEKAVNAASRAVDRWTGRRFWQDASPVVRRYRPTSPEVAYIHDVSTTDGLLVETGSGIDWTNATAWTLDADYELGPENADADGGAYAWWRLTPVSGRYFLTGYRQTTLRVTARWGWSEVPDQVVEATILRAVAIFKRKDAVYGVADFGEFGPVRITRADPDVMDLLRPFQKPMAG